MKKIPVFLTFLAIAAICHARTITVNPDGSGDYPTIQAAINDANNGDEVVLMPGTYTGPGNRDIDFLGKAITVRGTDPNDPTIVAATIIDCQHSGGGFRLVGNQTSHFVLAGLTITGASSSAVTCDFGSLTVTNCNIIENLSCGIELRMGMGSASIDGCNINANRGGIAASGSSVTIRDSSIADNSCEGVVCHFVSLLIIANCRIKGNGVGLNTSAHEIKITDCLIDNNYGCGIRAYYSLFNVVSCTVASNGDSGIDAEGIDTVISDCTFTGNYNSGIDVLSDKTIISDCIVTKNAPYGGIFASGDDIAIENCIISHNAAGIGSWWRAGGGIYAVGDVTLTNCLISRNLAGEGGAIYCFDGNMQIANCTIFANACMQYSSWIRYPAIWCDGDLNITNSIIWNGGSEIYPWTKEVRYSCISDEDGWGDWGPTNIYIDPQLTRDGHLTAGSPCIDAGDPNYVPNPAQTDIQGESRLYGARIDMGADEFHDQDADCLADFWERIYFGDPNLADPNEDNDSDGRANLQEYINGTSPNDVPVTYYVDPIEGDDTCDGLAPAADMQTHTIVLDKAAHGPKRTIQAAVDACRQRHNDVVVLAQGIYNGQGNRDIDFAGKAITIRSADPNDPDIVSATVVDSNGTENEPHRAFEFLSGEGPDSVLAGVTIIKGYAPKEKILDFWEYSRVGGGVFCRFSSPTIYNCTIRENTGGGIFFSKSASLLSGCSFLDNYSASYGGGVRILRDSDLTIIDCEFEANAAWTGGALHCKESSCTMTRCAVKANNANRAGGIYAGSCRNITIADCNISYNVAEGFDGYGGGYGGGMQVSSTRNVYIANSLFHSNHSEYGGGALYSLDNMKTVITNCVFNENSAFSKRSKGGGVLCEHDRSFVMNNCTFTSNSIFGQYGLGGAMMLINDGGEKPTIQNCLFAGNSAVWRGGGLYTRGVNIINCTLVGNKAGETGGALTAGDYTDIPAVLTNCILRNNRAACGNQIAQLYRLNVSYSNVEGGQADVCSEHPGYLNWGPGCIDTDPCFVEPGFWDANGTPADANDDYWVHGDYRLLEDSNCINTGDPCHPYDPNETDLDGKSRIFEGRIDMGAYEYAPPIEAQLRITPQTLNCKSKGKWLKARVTLPEGLTAEDIDVNTPAVLEPAGIESEHIRVLNGDDYPARLEAVFDRETFCDSLDENGLIEIELWGRLNTSQYFYATDTIKVSNCE